MTGQELIDLLLQLPDEWLGLEVYTEGCDCEGDIGGIDTVERGKGKVLLLHRSDGDYISYEKPRLERPALSDPTRTG